MDNKLYNQIRLIAQKARKASLGLSQVSVNERNSALVKLAKAVRQHKNILLKANEKDVASALKQKYSAALVDRLTLNEQRIEAMAKSLEGAASLNDPIGSVMETTMRPNGLKIQKVRVPIGVVAIIYESRPNVTADCMALCIKSGNAVILKGGKEAAHSNAAIFKVCRQALVGTSIPVQAIQLITSFDRKALEILLQFDGLVDLVIPRGGEGLIHFVAQHSRIPVIKHYKGVCHTFVSKNADLALAQKVCLNAKVQRPGTCNAMEKMLVDKAIAQQFLPEMIRQFQNAGVEIRGDQKTRRIVKGLKPAVLEDWNKEYLDLVLTVKVVDDLDSAIDHINTFGSHHSDAIITENGDEKEKFFKGVDSACVYANASTRFTDGYEFGMGAEVGISTDKIHARGPMGLEGLTTYKFIVSGNGQIRQ